MTDGLASTAVRARLDGSEILEIPTAVGHHAVIEPEPGVIAWAARDTRRSGTPEAWITADRLYEAPIATASAPREVVNLHDDLFGGTYTSPLRPRERSLALRRPLPGVRVEPPELAVHLAGPRRLAAAPPLGRHRAARRPPDRRDPVDDGRTARDVHLAGRRAAVERGRRQLDVARPPVAGLGRRARGVRQRVPPLAAVDLDCRARLGRGGGHGRGGVPLVPPATAGSSGSSATS